jgi:hypothetical protein
MCVLYDSQKNSEITQYAVQNVRSSRRGTRLGGSALAALVQFAVICDVFINLCLTMFVI